MRPFLQLHLFSDTVGQGIGQGQLHSIRNQVWHHAGQYRRAEACISGIKGKPEAAADIYRQMCGNHGGQPSKLFQKPVHQSSGQKAPEESPGGAGQCRRAALEAREYRKAHHAQQQVQQNAHTAPSSPQNSQSQQHPEGLQRKGHRGNGKTDPGFF